MSVTVASVVGARPQFIKCAMLARALQGRPGVAHELIHTGQHYDDAMSQVFFDELDIPKPNHDLEVGSAGHGAQTGRMLERLEEVFLARRYDWVVVYGDTNSTLAGALAAAKLHLPIAHVEAGLRSFNRAMPEEINRVVADHVADILFAPTGTAAAHLAAEGVAAKRVAVVGDVMYDAALFYAERAEQRSSVIDDLGLRDTEYVLVTVHRAENTDDGERLRAVVQALEALARDLTVVWPVHPRAAAALETHGLRPESPGLVLVPPAGYLDMVSLERHARLVATDSGGVQKEAFFHRVPCVTLRNETEWTELVDLGWNRLASPAAGSAAMASEIESALRSGPGLPGQPYGDGHSAERMAEHLTG